MNKDTQNLPQREKFEVELELPISLKPWSQGRFTYQPQHVERVEKAVVPPGFRIDEVMIANVLTNEERFPWPAMEPGDVVRITVANETGSTRQAKIKLEGTRVRWA